MILHMLIAVLLSLTQVSQTVESDDPNVFIDLGSEHCATGIVFAAYEYVVEDEVAETANPAYMTYSAFQFESVDQAVAAFEDAPVLVAETFSDDPDISDDPAFDELVTEVVTADYGDISNAYIMTLPLEGEEPDILTIEMLSIVEEAQLLLILMFSETGTTRPSVGLTLETVPPFIGDLDERWEGIGDLEEAVPAEDEMPLGWEGERVILEDPPDC
ncbi:MAG TPA: hypothetical protein VGR22_02380 [Thermomicrobiales bacterium]|nr:hypothetical protein [Thermomicrobiales bacterium]